MASPMNSLIPNTSPNVYPTYTYTAPNPEVGRLRFALELIAEGGLTIEAAEKIAKKAINKAE